MNFDRVIVSILGIIGLILLAIILSFIVLPIQVAAWVIGLDIPPQLKMFLLENIFTFILFLIGIPAVVVGKIAKLF